MVTTPEVDEADEDVTAEMTGSPDEVVEGALVWEPPATDDEEVTAADEEDEELEQPDWQPLETKQWSEVVPQ